MSDQPKNKKKIILPIVIALLLIALAVGVFLLRDQVSALISGLAGAQPVVNPALHPGAKAGGRYVVQTGAIEKTLQMLGNIEYEESAVLKWKTAGVVERVNVRIGDMVKKGDILAVLATDSLSSAVLTAEKTLIDATDAAANLMVSEVKKYQIYATLTTQEQAYKATQAAQENLYFPRASSLELDMAYDAFTLAEQNYEYAKEDFRVILDNYKSYEDEARWTYAEAYQQSYSSLQSAYAKWQYLRAAPKAAELAFAQGAVASAQRTYDELLKDYNSYTVIPRDKDLAQAKSNLAVAEKTHEQRYLLAPFDGVIDSVYAEVDQVVTSETAGFNLVDQSAYYLQVNVNEIDLEKIALAQEIDVAISVLPEGAYKGVVVSIDRAGTNVSADSELIRFVARVKLINPDDRIKAGMTASVNIPIVQKTGVMLVPVAAVTIADGNSTVERVTSNGSETVDVTLGVMTGLSAEVVGGDLRVGDELLWNTVDERFYQETGIRPAPVSKDRPAAQPAVQGATAMPEGTGN